MRYELFQDLDDENHIVLLEEWRGDQASLLQDLASEHLSAMVQEVMPILVDKGRRTRVARVG
ncbi:putative quinol monooxygenase [Amycolatopsis sp. cmx-4-61]|uniref:putative quinol monooxygenase n=1 Tax=Amycolatopsis sp. cmx-4-61 TaxID=2790937 RepID=UPI00397CA673